MSRDPAHFTAVAASVPKGKRKLATLADIREEIDRIDAQMHALLIERSAVVSDLIAIKKVQPPVDGDPARRTSAFRPAREASMMHAMIERHSGLLPLDTVESIWRVIISTFTYVQAPYDVIYAHAGHPLDMRDVSRFHFGYTVPLTSVDGADAVLSAVGTRGDALGLVPLHATGAWWQALEADDAPNVIARLPFVERADHPAGMPCLVVANAPIDREVMAATVLSVRLDKDAAEALPDTVDILAHHADQFLLSVADDDALTALQSHWGVHTFTTVGSHAPLFRA
ncbi:MAG: chorismate mutase [Pseudomonadota bacterium]